VSIDLTQKPKTADDVLRVSIEHAEGSGRTIITPNWSDKTSWYYAATKCVAQELVDQGDQLHYRSPTYPKSWVDNYHAKYTGEDFLVTKDGDVPRLKVYVDGVQKTEQDPHYGSGGDFVVDYSNGEVTFLTTLSAAAVVTCDVWESGSSLWVIKPISGKLLKVIGSEVQFSTDVLIKDSTIFAAYGPVDVFAPDLTPTPYPSGTMIPLGNPTIYKTKMDFINESNGSMPRVLKTEEVGATWRDLQVDVDLLPWDYKAVKRLVDFPVLNSSMELRIYLEHDEPMGGTNATATFYCMSYDA